MMMDATGISLASLAMSREVTSRRAWTWGRKEGDHHGNTAEVERNDGHLGDTALGQRGTRACVEGRAWGGATEVEGMEDTITDGMGRRTGWYWHRHSAILGALLGTDDMPIRMPIRTPIRTPMRTHLWSPPHRPSSRSNPHPRRRSSRLHQPLGITVTTHGGITPTCSNVQGDGEQWPPRRHKPEAAGPRAHHPARVSSVPRVRQRDLTPHHWALIVGQSMVCRGGDCCSLGRSIHTLRARRVSCPASVILRNRSYHWMRSLPRVSWASPQAMQDITWQG